MWGWIKGLFGKRKPDDSGGDKKGSMSRQKLTDLTRGIHHAASTTQAMLAEQFIRMFDQFFDSEEDGSLTAKMVRIQHPGDQNQFLMVPLISLVAPKGIVMNKMEVEMSVRIEEAYQKYATDYSDNSEATRCSFKVSFAPKSGLLGRSSDLTTIKMTFEAGDPPEGVMRVIEEFTNGIHPQKKERVDQIKHTPIGQKAKDAVEAADAAKATADNATKHANDVVGGAQDVVDSTIADVDDVVVESDESETPDDDQLGT